MIMPDAIVLCCGSRYVESNCDVAKGLKKRFEVWSQATKEKEGKGDTFLKLYDSLSR